jgi:hypothetical protein
MRGEELARPVNQQIVQLRLQTTPVGQPKIVAYPIKLRSQRLLPPGLVDRDPILGDFPRVADAAVEAGLILEAMAGRPGNVSQLARRGWGDRETNAADALDFEVEILGCDGLACRERADEPIRASSRLTSSNIGITLAIFVR